MLSIKQCDPCRAIFMSMSNFPLLKNGDSNTVASLKLPVESHIAMQAIVSKHFMT